MTTVNELTKNETFELMNLIRDFLVESTRLTRLAAEHPEGSFLYVVYESNAEYLFKKAASYYEEHQDVIEKFRYEFQPEKR